MLTRGGLEVRLHMFLYIGSMYVYIYTHIYCRCIKTMYLLCLRPRCVNTRGLGGEAPHVFIHRQYVCVYIHTHILPMYKNHVSVVPKTTLC